MTQTVDPTRVEWPDVPTSAWALGWSFVVSQLVQLALRGAQPQENWALSILLGVAVVVLVSHGVIRARAVRFWFVVVVLVASALFGLVGLAVDASVAAVVDLVLTLTQLALLRAFARTEWFALQRARVSGAPRLTAIMAVAVLVGVLAGVLGSPSAGVGATVSVG